MQLGEVVRAVVGHRMSLQPCPQVFDGIEIGCVRRQEGDLDVAADGIEVVANQMAAVRPQSIPYHQQGLLQVGLERLEESDNFFLLDTALVQPEQEIAARQSGNDRDVVPVEVELDDRRLTLGCPGAHPCGPLAQARFIDKDDQTALALGFFLSAGHVRSFQ